jgi:hypothetical protein
MGNLNGVGTLAILLIVAAGLVGVFSVLVVTLYIVNGVKNHRDTGRDEFEKRNDDREVYVLDTAKEAEKYSADQKYHDGLAQLEADRLAFEKEKEDMKAKAEAEKAAKEAEAAIVPSAEIVPSNDDFFAEATDERRGDDLREELSKRDQKRAEKERQRAQAIAEREAAKAAKHAPKNEQSDLFGFGNDDGAPAMGGGDNPFSAFGIETEHSKPEGHGHEAHESKASGGDFGLFGDIWGGGEAAKGAGKAAGAAAAAHEAASAFGGAFEMPAAAVEKGFEAKERNAGAAFMAAGVAAANDNKELDYEIKDLKRQSERAEREAEKERERYEADMRKMAERFEKDMKSLEEKLASERVLQDRLSREKPQAVDNTRERELELAIEKQKSEFGAMMQEHKMEQERMQMQFKAEQEREKAERLAEKEKEKREAEINDIKEKFRDEIDDLREELVAVQHKKIAAESASVPVIAAASAPILSERERELEKRLDEVHAEFKRFLDEKKAEEDRRAMEERKRQIALKRKREADERKAELLAQQHQFQAAIEAMQAQHKEALQVLQSEMVDLKTKLKHEDKQSAEYEEARAEKAEKEEAIEREKREFEILRKELERQNREMLEKQKEQMDEYMQKTAAFEANLQQNKATVDTATRELFAQMSEEIERLRTQIDEQGGRKTKEQSEEIASLNTAMGQLLEDRKRAREEARILQEEFEAERNENQKRLSEQFDALQKALESQKQKEYEEAIRKIEKKKAEEFEITNAQAQLEREEREALVEGLRREKAQYEAELRRQYDELKREMEAKIDMAKAESEQVEAQIKAQYEEYKASIAEDARELENRNRALAKELDRAEKERAKAEARHASIDIEAERAKIAEQLRDEYDQNERLLSEKYMQLRSELQRESRQLAEKSDEVRQEMADIEKQRAILEKQASASKGEFEDERRRLADELAADKKRIEDELKAEKKRLEEENRKLRDEMAKNPDVRVVEKIVEIEKAVIDMGEVERLKEQLQRDYEANERLLREKYSAMQSEMQHEQAVVKARHAELEGKEKQIAAAEARVADQSREVHAAIADRNYSAEEKARILADYREKLESLRERLRLNEKSIRDNNREYVPLRRIKDTLDRDLKLLRKREAVVAKQQVLVYGVNNITTLDPERVKKLEQDVKQLTGLQSSVANCEEILAKNKDRFPTLVNLDKVLKTQNSQIQSDIEELQESIKFFENYVPKK